MAASTMIGFGPKQAWLAVENANPAALLAQCGLRDLGAISWRHGIDLAYLTDDRIAITPELRDERGRRWVLAVGRWLVLNSSTVDVADLSSSLGSEVQFFVSYRVTELHRWERAANGVLVRAFEFLGQTGEITRWHGAADDAELALGLPSTPDPDSSIIVAEQDVFTIARSWSVDPTALQGEPAPGSLHLAATATGS